MSVLVNTEYNKLGSINELASELAKIIDENTIFVCVGTDRIIGDSLGPIVGSLLQDRIPNKVYGTVEYPVHALNVNEIGKTIKEKRKPARLPFLVPKRVIFKRISAVPRSHRPRFWRGSRQMRQIRPGLLSSPPDVRQNGAWPDRCRCRRKQRHLPG